MDNSNTIKQEEKRKEAAKTVLVVFPKAKENNYSAFNIVDESGNLKYDGNVEINPSIVDNCTCPSFTNGNKPKGQGEYSDVHGFAFQCKHIMAARDEAKKQSDQVDMISNEISQKQNEINEFIASVKKKTFHESGLIDKSVLLE